MPKPTLRRADELAAEKSGTALGAADAPAVEKRVLPNNLPKQVYDAIVEERKANTRRGGRPSYRTRDAVIALQYRRLGKLTDAVISRLERALANEEDPLHAMAVERLMQRVVPQSFWESLGRQEFQETEGEKSPQFVINIGTARAPEPQAVDVVPKEKE